MDGGLQIFTELSLGLELFMDNALQTKDSAGKMVRLRPNPDSPCGDP